MLLHFWKCDDPVLPENTSCYVDVQHIEALYKEYCMANIIHPNGKLETKDYGMKEFSVLDCHGNLIKFGEELDE